ncbi:glycosyltransferase [Candidatus Saccharibacteria bacterium]|nr:glycosyltransferase [Candidatus Saccharibacteria bacterium]
MKVLHLLSSDSFSGAENVAISIIENLRDNDNYEFVYVSKDGEIRKVLDEKGINHHLVSEINLKSVKKIIEEEKPDIIHAHDYRASTFTALTGFKGKIISHIHNNWPFAKKWNKYTIIFKTVSRKFDNIVFVSTATFDEAVYKKSVEEKSLVLPNIIDKEKIKKLSQETNEYGKFDVGFIGRITEQKNPEQFVRIVEKISEKKNVKAVMIGAGEIDTKKLDIKKTGYLENPYRVLKDCKCVVMPSRWEGFGLTAIECLSLNVPVFNSGVGGLSEIFAENEEYICKTDEEYIEKILNYLENPEKPKVNIDRFTDKKAYYGKIKELYES